MRKLTLSIIGIILAVSANSTAFVSAGVINIDTQSARAQEVLDKARATIGGEAKLNAVVSLSASGKLQRVINNETRSGEISLDIVLSGKLRKTETLSILDGIDVTTVSILNGDQAWRQVSSSSSIAQVVNNPESKTAQAQAAKLQDLRNEFARQLLSWLLVAPPSFPVEVSYVGEAVADDGQADVIALKGAEEFSLRLFIDKKTHRPLMATYRGSARKIIINDSTSKGNSQDASKLMKENQKGNQGQPSQQSDIELHFADYRSVEGVLLPHRITKVINGEVSEEWQMEKYKINPSLKPEKFEKK